MTIEEIQAEIDLAKETLKGLEDDLQEAIEIGEVNNIFTAMGSIKTDFDAETITAAQARHELEKIGI